MLAAIIIIALLLAALGLAKLGGFQAREAGDKNRPYKRF